ncbi:MAG: hypothetical protein ABSA09_10890 [Desulfobaccales bacterium]
MAGGAGGGAAASGCCMVETRARPGAMAAAWTGVGGELVSGDGGCRGSGPRFYRKSCRLAAAAPVTHLLLLRVRQAGEGTLGESPGAGPGPWLPQIRHKEGV